ncbi:hypothetical protein BSIN_2262 [Burkholderia singularis]|uniref:Uncharacterized protein n=1 Tax=Burkholderia singularis TaxID=1503053 RepID=A0A238H1C6_9BURK|nr:hypothetical protein BSIN_2262 [Burkholderia singularis]
MAQASGGGSAKSRHKFWYPNQSPMAGRGERARTDGDF